MNTLNPEAQILNDVIEKSAPAIFNLLSGKGRSIYFPKKGVIKQGAEAKGKRINATIGMAVEDDKSPMRLKSIASLIQMDPSHVFPYAPSYGLLELRKIWRKQIQIKNPGLDTPISLPLVTNGLSHALNIIGYLFVDPGDDVILTDIFWGNYRLILNAAYGGNLTCFQTFEGKDFNLDALRTQLQSKAGKQILLLNFPNNPTGYTPTNDEAAAIVEIIRQGAEQGNQVLVVLDDAYFGLVYQENIYKESLFAELAGLHENVLAVKIDGATKEDYAWGLRVGFITYGSKGCAPDVYQALEEKTGGAIRGSISNVNHISQSLILQALNAETYAAEKEEKYDLLKQRYARVTAILAENEEHYSKYFQPLPFNSGYFMCVELNQDLVADNIRCRLLNEYDTGVIAIKNLIRIAYSSVAEKNIPTLFNNLYEACRKESGEQ